MVNQRKSVEHLFEQALALKASERSAFLDEACSSSPELREKVARLLDEDAQAGSFLNSPLFGRPNTAGPPDEATADTWPHDPEDSQWVDTVPDGCFSANDLLAGRFRIVRFIAAGGMGEVYEVEDRQLQGVRLALKTILPHIAANPHMQERFEREVLLARRVVHPNLCPIYDIFRCRHQDTDLMFLTMKLLPGETLASRIKREGAIPLDEARRIVSQVGAALAAAHDAGILHRDIKTANIMLAGSGEQVHAWVTDFGLARAYQGETTVLTAEGVAGTPGYVAPELFLGVPPSKASDVYAFGVVIYKMVTGFSPPVRLDPKAKVTRDPFTEQLPSEWKRLIEHCLEPSVDKRCQSFPEVVGSLRGGDRRKQVASGIAAKLSRRRFVAMGAGAAAAVAGGVWLDWTQIDFAMHPLPAKRFVTLLAWPSSSSIPILTTVLDSISSRLTRAEADVKDLLIVSSSDIPAKGGSLNNPKDSVTSLGANLVLAASLQTTPTVVTLVLQVLDASTQRVLRRGRVSRKSGDLSGLTEAAAENAARMLGLPDHQVPLKDPVELQRVSPEVFRLFSDAEQLANEPNDVGLEAAIQKYQDALGADPHFALGYARLATAYARQHLKTGVDTKIPTDLNANLALYYNLDSAKALLSKGMLLLYSGNSEKALDYFNRSLNIDPDNPETLLYKAQAYRNENRFADAKALYEELLKKRPNYWPAYNELGYIEDHQANYLNAIDNFNAASVVAPQVALPLANLGTEYFKLGKRPEAIEAWKRSVRNGPNLAAWMFLGDMAFEDHRYDDALKAYTAASLIKPSYHLIWRNIGDCYQVVHNMDKMKENYIKAARALEKTVVTNSKSGLGWATLAFYHAKIGETPSAEADLRNVEVYGGKDEDIESQFMVVQALALLGRKEEALKLLLACMDKGLAQVEIDLALDINSLQKDSRYIEHVHALKLSNRVKAS